MTFEKIEKKKIPNRTIIEAIEFIEDINACAITDFDSKIKDIYNLKECRRKLQQLLCENEIVLRISPNGGLLDLSNEERNEICMFLINQIEEILTKKFHILPPEFDDV